MRRALVLGTAIAAVAFLANVNTASADHCYSGGYGRGYGGGFGGGYSHHRHSHGGYGYSNYRYSTPYHNSYYGSRRGGYSYYPRNRYYGGSGVYIQGRNFGFGLRY